MKKRETIIESAIRHIGQSGFDVATTLEISHEADGTKPPIYYLISHLVDLLKHTATVFQKLHNITYHQFQTFNDLPKNLRKIVSNFSGKLKNEPITAKIKIVIFSGYSELEKIEKAFKAGADLYIAKPVDFSTIEQIIEDAANTSEFPSIFIKELDRVYVHD